MMWTVEERVEKRGAKVLDAYFGSRGAWTSKVRGQLLDMNDFEWCVLGQLFGNYHTGLYELTDLWLERDWDDEYEISVSHGFELWWDDETNQPEPELILRAAWLRLINA